MLGIVMALYHCAPFTHRLFSAQSKGGRPRKVAKGRGCAVQECNTAQLLHHIAGLSHHIPSLKPQEIDYLHTDAFLPPPAPTSLDFCTCPICMAVLDVPVSLTCGHVVCSQCLSKSLQFSPTCPTCPCCPMSIGSTADIGYPADDLLDTLKSLQVKCFKAHCDAVISLGDLRDHHKEGPRIHQANPTTPPSVSQHPSPSQTPSAINLRQVLDAPLDKTPNIMEVRATTHLLKRMMHSSSECAQGSRLRLPTGGQVSPKSCHGKQDNAPIRKHTYFSVHSSVKCKCYKEKTGKQK